MYKIQEESGLKAIAECLRLGKLHYHEVFEDKEKAVPPNYNWGLLKLCEENGLIHLVTARDEKGELIGYFGNLVSPDMLSSTFTAREIGIFVRADYRRSGVYTKMLACMENRLRENGVTTQYLAFQKGHNDKVPLKHGYKLRELVYEKILEDAE